MEFRDGLCSAVHSEHGVDSPEPRLQQVGVVISEEHYISEIKVGSAPAGGWGVAGNLMQLVLLAASRAVQSAAVPAAKELSVLNMACPGL
jgi:hypothetical protein